MASDWQCTGPGARRSDRITSTETVFPSKGEFHWPCSVTIPRTIFDSRIENNYSSRVERIAPYRPAVPKPREVAESVFGTYFPGLVASDWAEPRSALLSIPTSTEAGVITSKSRTPSSLYLKTAFSVNEGEGL